MQNVTHRTEELVREAGIRVRVAIDAIVRLADAARSAVRPPPSTWACSSSSR